MTEGPAGGRSLFEADILTVADRAAFAAYCQSCALWAEASAKLGETPKLIRTPSGYVRQSPWVSIASKPLDLMGRHMAELGITPTARARVPDPDDLPIPGSPITIQPVGVCRDADGNVVETAETSNPISRDDGT